MCTIPIVGSWLHVNISIKPCYKSNFIHVTMDIILHVPLKKIQSTQVDGETVANFKDFEGFYGELFVVESNFPILAMDNVDLVLVHPWMQQVQLILMKINVHKAMV